ncbi:MAG TPA: GNAT family N-acetyltransferase [Vicinamibacterales bacterium]
MLPGIIRSAVASDASALYEIRRDAICVLASRGMPEEMAERWASSRTLAWVQTIIKERDVWVFEADTVVAASVSVSADTIDGLYTLPLYEQRGVASRLLAFVETQMRGRGLLAARAGDRLECRSLLSAKGI